MEGSPASIEGAGGGGERGSSSSASVGSGSVCWENV